jgi:hypothetical protein
LAIDGHGSGECSSIFIAGTEDFEGEYELQADRTYSDRAYYHDSTNYWGIHNLYIYFSDTLGGWCLADNPDGVSVQFRAQDEANTPDAITAEWQVCSPPSSGNVDDDGGKIGCNATFGWQPAPRIHASCYVPPPPPACGLVLVVGASTDDLQFAFQPGVGAGERPTFSHGDNAYLYFSQTASAWYIRCTYSDPPPVLRVLDEANTPDAITAEWQVCNPPSSGNEDDYGGEMRCNATFGWQPAPRVHASCYVPPRPPECRSLLVAGGSKFSLRRFDVLPGIGAGERVTYAENGVVPVNMFVFFCKTQGAWYISDHPDPDQSGTRLILRVLDKASTLDAITAEWEVCRPLDVGDDDSGNPTVQCNATFGWQPAPDVHTSCDLPVTHAWQNSSEVIVDQFRTAGAMDTQDCGVEPALPCRTVRWGAMRVKPGGTLFVHGSVGGGAYLGECSAGGIVINASLSVVGIGGAVIDCLGEPRFITFDGLAVRNSSGPAQLTLEALEVRNSNMTAVSSTSQLLVVNNCAFVNCSTIVGANVGSAISMVNEISTASLHLIASSFTNCGGPAVKAIALAVLTSCTFVGTTKCAFPPCTAVVVVNTPAPSFMGCNFTRTNGVQILPEFYLTQGQHSAALGHSQPRYQNMHTTITTHQGAVRLKQCNFNAAVEFAPHNGIGVLIPLIAEHCFFSVSFNIQASMSSISSAKLASCTFSQDAAMMFDSIDCNVTFVGCSFESGWVRGKCEMDGSAYIAFTQCTFLGGGFDMEIGDGAGAEIVFRHCNFSGSSIATKYGSKMHIYHFLSLIKCLHLFFFIQFL